jgi:hypothetical protein
MKLWKQRFLPGALWGVLGLLALVWPGARPTVIAQDTGQQVTSSASQSPQDEAAQKKKKEEEKKKKRAEGDSDTLERHPDLQGQGRTHRPYDDTGRRPGTPRENLEKK